MKVVVFFHAIMLVSQFVWHR